MGTPLVRKKLVRAALGQVPLDLVIKDLRIVNVYTSEIEAGALGILEGRIVSLNPDGLDRKETRDGSGRYAMPGFIDAHVHLDSSLITPEMLASLIVPIGTTVMLADPMESTNVGGYKGLEALLTARESLPYHLYIEVSSRVPTAPDLETTGGKLDLEEVREVLTWPSAISLGELDPSKVLGLKDGYFEKVAAAHALGKIANGHAAGLSGRELEAYICGGLSDDHECVDYVEALERLRLGLPIFVREGSTERNLEPIIKGVVEENLDTRHLMFCTDDKHPDDILEEGHIDYMINKAIELGLDPVTAIQMATVNAAVHFRVDGELGSLTPGRWADIVLADDLQRIEPTHVFYKGELVARDGQLVKEPESVSYPAWFSSTVQVTRGIKAEDFRLEHPGPQAEVKVIGLYPVQIINRVEKAHLKVEDGNVVGDPGQDVLKIAVVERYGKNGNIGISFVKGFGLKRGAIASSVAHDHHNIIVAGTDERDMARCVQAVQDMQGGLVVAADDRVLGKMPLPLGGLMSELSAKEAIAVLDEITEIYHDLGGTLPAPFMTISFISLPTVPEFGLTDKGLVDVREHRLVSPFVG
jgi:adenine deaminase